jgi:hypothetical protein
VKLQYSNINVESLRKALVNTAEKRNTIDIVRGYSSIMAVVKSSEIMQQRWLKYQKDFEYASDIAFDDTCDTVVQIMSEIEI